MFLLAGTKSTVENNVAEQ